MSSAARVTLNGRDASDLGLRLLNAVRMEVPRGTVCLIFAFEDPAASLDVVLLELRRLATTPVEITVSSPAYTALANLWSATPADVMAAGQVVPLIRSVSLLVRPIVSRGSVPPPRGPG